MNTAQFTELIQTIRDCTLGICLSVFGVMVMLLLNLFRGRR